MKVFIILVIFAVSSALAAPSVLDNKLDNSSNGNLSRMTKMLGSCVEDEDITTCLAVKGISALNRASKASKIEILPGVTFSRDTTNNVARSERLISEPEIMSTLSSDSDEKTGQLIDLAMESASNFMSSHNLEIKLPSEATQEMARALNEGRGKMKKLMGPLIMAVGVKLVALIPIFLGGLALLATKALVVAKIAFVLAIALGASKLLGGGGSSVLGKITGGAQNAWSGGNVGGGWSSGGQGWSSGSSGAYPYARSLDAQHLAYKSQILSEKSE